MVTQAFFADFVLARVVMMISMKKVKAFAPHAPLAFYRCKKLS
jgi:hypothetical protein